MFSRMGLQVVVAAGFLLFTAFAPNAEAQSCTCSQVIAVQVTCCSKTISTYACQGNNSCRQCDPFYRTIPCCPGSDTGKAGYVTNCKGPNPNAVIFLSKTAVVPKGERVYVPTCSGGYVAARRAPSPEVRAGD